MKRAIWFIGFSVSALVAVSLTGLVGLVNSAGLIMAPPEADQVAAVVPAPTPPYDQSKPTVAVVLGNTRTEATDFLAPYAMFAESGAYNVYAVADSREIRTLAGGVDIVPQLTFAELEARLPAGPDVVLVPAITKIDSPENAAVLDWLRGHGDGPTLFSWCAGAEVLAASGLIDGRPVTTHWSDINGFERAYPAVEWLRGLRYVDDGDLLTTGGITAGVDATLHFLATRNGEAVADRVAQAMHYTDSPFLDDPAAPQYTFEPVDAAVYLNLAFNWPKPDAAVWLYDGVGEVDLAAAVEAFGVTSVNATTTVADADTVTSDHGLQIVPRRQAHELTPVSRVLVPGGVDAWAAAERIPTDLLNTPGEVTVLANEQAPTYAFTLVLQELAASHNVAIAEYDARQLEVRSPLNLVGPRWPVNWLIVPALAALGGCVVLWATARLVRRLRGSSDKATGRRRMHGTMKAIVQRSYGGPEILTLQDVERPSIGPDEVLVRVRAASVNAADWIKLTGKPYLVRPVFGLLRPKQSIAGGAMAGTVEAVGAQVTQFAPGDEVYGEIRGAFAEYAKVRPAEIARKPRTLSFEQAAAIPVAGVTALQALVGKGHLKAGDSVLVNGASGGVGTFAVQIAKAYGATVTGVASTSKVDLVRSVGADHVVDYNREDFTMGDRRYDVILDLAGNRSLGDVLRVLKPGGVFVSSVGRAGGAWLGVAPRLIGLRFAARGRSENVAILAAHQTRADLETLAALADAGRLVPSIDRTYPLAETADALRLFGSGRVRGKVGLAV